MANEKTGPTGRAITTERPGDPDRSSVASRALVDVLDEEGGRNGPRSLSAPASRGTGPVDPAYDFVDNERS